MVIKAVVTLALILLLILIVTPAFRFGKGTPHVRILLELEQLENALLMYQAKNGELFPNAGDHKMFQHLRRVNPQATGISESFDSRKLDTRSLDDAEMLVLFLGEAADEILERRSGYFFDFPPDRLKDSDADGWLEFVSYEGETFRYVGGHPVVYCVSVCAWMTAEPAERKNQIRKCVNVFPCKVTLGKSDPRWVAPAGCDLGVQIAELL